MKHQAHLWGGPRDGEKIVVAAPPDDDTPPETIAITHLDDAVMYEPVRRMEKGEWRYEPIRLAGTG